MGNLDVAKLKSLGIPPGPPYAQLRKGQSVTSPSGEVVNPLDVCSVKPGKKVVITGDTSDPKEVRSNKAAILYVFEFPRCVSL